MKKRLTQKKSSIPPRYIVQFPDGERKVDALEMLRLYEERKLNFSTLIRPVTGGEFRRFDADAEFAPLLRRLYNSQRLILSAWLYPVSRLFFLAFLLVFPLVLMPLSCFRFAIFLAVPWGLAAPIDLLSYCKKNPKLNWQYSLLIPYWNCFRGWKMFHRLSRQLPEKRQHLVQILNPLFWLALAVFYGGTVWFPGNEAGGSALWLVLLLTMLFGLLLAIPFRLGTHAEYLRWQKENPKPPLFEKRLFPLPQPKWLYQWSRTDFRRAVCTISCFALALTVWLVPFYVTGKLRCLYYKKLLEQEGIPIRNIAVGDVPCAAGELLAIQLPALPEKPTASDAEKLRPQLEQIRTILRKYERLGIHRKNYESPELEQVHRLLHTYLHWSWLLPENPPKEMLLDLDRCRDYETLEDPYSGVLWESIYANWRKHLLHKHLSRFTDTELAQEKTYLMQELAAWPQRGKAAIYYEGKFAIQCFEQMFLSWYMFPFRENIRAALLHHVVKQLEVTRQRFYAPQEAGEEEKSLLGLLSPMIFFGSAGSAYFNTLARYRLSLSAIEVEQYRRQHQEFPDSPDLSEDPFSGQPLHYIKGEKIYSVGRDGMDDGGRTKQRHPDETIDIVFDFTPPER